MNKLTDTDINSTERINNKLELRKQKLNQSLQVQKENMREIKMCQQIIENEHKYNIADDEFNINYTLWNNTIDVEYHLNYLCQIINNESNKDFIMLFILKNLELMLEDSDVKILNHFLEAGYSLIKYSLNHFISVMTIIDKNKINSIEDSNDDVNLLLKLQINYFNLFNKMISIKNITFYQIMFDSEFFNILATIQFGTLNLTNIIILLGNFISCLISKEITFCNNMFIDSILLILSRINSILIENNNCFDDFFISLYIWLSKKCYTYIVMLNLTSKYEFNNNFLDALLYKLSNNLSNYDSLSREVFELLDYLLVSPYSHACYRNIKIIDFLDKVIGEAKKKNYNDMLYNSLNCLYHIITISVSVNYNNLYYDLNEVYSKHYESINIFGLIKSYLTKEGLVASKIVSIGIKIYTILLCLQTNYLNKNSGEMNIIAFLKFSITILKKNKSLIVELSKSIDIIITNLISYCDDYAFIFESSYEDIINLSLLILENNDDDASMLCLTWINNMLSHIQTRKLNSLLSKVLNVLYIEEFTKVLFYYITGNNKSLADLSEIIKNKYLINL